MSRRNRIGLLTAVAVLLLCAPARAAQLSDSEVRDKIAGGWIGGAIGGAWGKPTEFRYLGRTVPASEVPRWNPRRANRYTYRGNSDETYVEIPFLDAQRNAGPGAGYSDWGAAFAATNFKLFFANLKARENLQAGLAAPLSGDPSHNHHAYDIDFQIEADWTGMAAPAQVGAATDLAWRAGHVIGYGDGVYGGVMIAAMHAAAFDAPNLRAIIDAGRDAVPEGTTYRAMIDDVLRWHHRHPRDWREAWRRLERRWNAHRPYAKRTRIQSEFNIDAKLNGGYVLLGLLYGHGDFARSVRISMRAGQDSDCNPSSVASILGNWRGLDWIPARFRHGIAKDRRLPHTSYTLGDAIDANVEVARQLSVARGGSVDSSGWNLAADTAAPAPFEQWTPFSRLGT